MSGDEVVGHKQPGRCAIVAAVAVVIGGTVYLTSHRLPSPRPAVTWRR